MKYRIFSVNLILILAFASANCTTTIRSSFQEQCDVEKWTNEQCDVAFYLGLREKFLVENDEGDYEPNYNALTREQVIGIFDDRLQDLDDLLDPKNEDNAKFLKEFELRSDLERREAIFKAGYSRLLLVDNNYKFRGFMGELSPSQSGHMDRFDTASVFVENLAEAYPFASAQIEQARANGSLEEVEHVIWFSERTLGRKESDPSDPNDPNKFIWKPVIVGLELVSYKIMNDQQPKDNRVEYIEGTRVEITESGVVERESSPSLKMFVSGNGRNSVLVIDKDREGEIGFLLPDFIERANRINSAEALMNDLTFSRLFHEPEDQKRVMPPDPPPITLTIALVGENVIDVWETSDDGWTVPMMYQNDRADNYRVSVKIEGDDEDGYDHASNNKKIEYFRKIWNGNGNVYEHFYSKSPYDQSNLVKVSVSGTRVVMVTNEGEEITGYITPGNNKFIQDNPYSIEYTESEVRWLLVDEDSDGKFEKRRQIVR